MRIDGFLWKGRGEDSDRISKVPKPDGYTDDRTA